MPSGSGLVYVPQNSKTTKVQEWNISAQRELSRSTSAMLAYVGYTPDDWTTWIKGGD